VSGHDRQAGVPEFAVDHMQVGAADGAGTHAQEHLPGPWRGNLTLLEPQRFADAREGHALGPHGNLVRG
jgi:hypothetical protein